jgi:alpha-methylacyl-CoA racemase
VIEFAGIGPGPYAGLLLAELGADVLRLERQAGIGLAGSSRGLTRSRPAVAVDLKSPAGRDLALELATQADVLIEGHRPGVMERLGLGPQECLELNPGLIYGRITGWGQEGPLSQAAGHDINYAGLTGALHMIGPREKPMPPVNLVADFGGGALFLVTGVLAALYERGRSGLGQVVDAAMVDGAASLTTLMYTMLGAGHWRDEREANYLDGGAPFYGTYRCADGRFVAVGAIEPQFYRALVTGLGVAHQLTGEQGEESAWPAHRAVFAGVFATRARDEWVARFEGTDACVTPVLSMTEAPQHPHLRARDTFVPVDGIAQPAVAPRFSRSRTRPPSSGGPAAAFALRGWGVTPERIDALIESGAIARGQPVAEAP